MKTKLIILILIATVSVARATLIDLTPGGFDLTQPLPSVVAQFFGDYSRGQQNLAGFNVVGGQVVWSPFTPFGPPNTGAVLNSAGTEATIDWNWLNTGFHGRFIFVESSALIGNLYRVVGLTRFLGNGFIEVDGSIPILAATFTGTFDGNNRVPDKSSTLVLFALGIATLVFFYSRTYRT